MELIKPGTKIDFLGRRTLFYGVSVIAVGVSLLSLVTLGLNFGIDFTGGSELQLTFRVDVGAGPVLYAVADSVFENPDVQRFETGGHVDYLVRIREQVTLIDAAKAAGVKEAIESQATALGKLTSFEAADSGDRLYVGFDMKTDDAALVKLLAEHGLPEAQVQVSGRPEDHLYVVQLQEIQGKVAADLKARFGEKFDQVARAQIVGPKAGKRLRNDGALSVLVALAAILFYIAVRFDFRFAPGAVFALVHDLTITLGLFSIFSHWLEFSLASIAALLTIVGYSLNDTIVVFDRIRENFDYSRDKDLTRLVNVSINETLSRTLLTSLTTLFVVLSLFLFGGGLIKDFAAALIIGVIVGTYSSIGIASPTVLWMHRVLPQLQEWFLPAKAAPSSGPRKR